MGMDKVDKMDYRWINKRASAKEISDVTIPGSEEIFYRSGTVNSLNEGLAVSLRSRIDFCQWVMYAPRFKKCFTLGNEEYIRIKSSRAGIVVKPRLQTRIELYGKPIDNLPQFDLWDPKLEFHRCPDNLVEGIAYIEGLMDRFDQEDSLDYQGIHVHEDYVIRFDYFTGSRFKLRSKSPFNMIFYPMGVKRLAPRLKTRKLRGVARYEAEIGTGVIFDFGDLRIWNMGLYSEVPYRIKYDNFNKIFNFPIDNFLEFPEDFVGILDTIRRTIDKEQDRIKFAIRKNKIHLTWISDGNPQQVIMRIPKPSIHQPISGEIPGISQFIRLVSRETFLGYENPDPARKGYADLYLKNRGEHIVRLVNIH
jgi:hypothetical protein